MMKSNRKNNHLDRLFRHQETTRTNTWALCSKMIDKLDQILIAVAHHQGHRET